MTEEDPNVAAYRRTAAFRQYLTACLANLCAFNVGTILGWTSPMQPLLTSDNPPVGSEPMSTELISWLGSINFIGAVCGTFFWGIFSDRLGRKRTALVVAIPLIVSWIMKIKAPNVWWLLAARVIAGVGGGGVLINTPIYIAEIAEIETRGSLGSFFMIFMIGGILFSFIVGSITSYNGLATICLSIPIIFLMTFSHLPESPVSLWNHGKKAEAEKSLLWFRGGNVTQTRKEIEVLKMRSGKPFEEPSLRDLFITKGVRKASIISIFLVIGLQCSGSLAILTYTYKIFQESGSSLSAHNSMIVVGVLKISASLVSSFLIDRAGRRFLLLTSYIAMCISLTTLASYLYFPAHFTHPLLKSIPIVCISVNVIFYSLGAVPVKFIVMSEIFPADISGFAISKFQLLGSSLAFVTVKTFPFLKSLLGPHGCFLFYALICAILSVFAFTIIPETKGKPLRTILKQLHGEDLSRTESEYTELFGIKKPTIVKSTVSSVNH